MKRSVVVAFGCVLIALAARGQTNLHVVASDGAWTWFNDPRAVFEQGRLVVAYVRNGDGRSVLSSYNPSNGVATTLWTSSWSERDDHDCAGLLPLQDGRMMAFYANHSSATNFAYRLSANALNPATWGPERIVGNGALVTYANPYQLSAENGRIYDFMRALNYNPTFMTSDNLGTNWSTPQILIRTGTGATRPYVKYASDYSSRIDFLYTDAHPNEGTNSLYHAYYQNGALYRTDGAFLKYLTNAPLLHDAGERGSLIYQHNTAPSSDFNDHMPGGRAWCWEIVYGKDSNPVCVFTVQRDNVTGPNWSDDRIYYYYARWTGSNWQKRFMAQAGRPLYDAERDYAGGICIDPEEPGTIYLSSNAADPFRLDNIDDVPLRAESRYELFRGVTVDGGLTFHWTALTTNSAADNLRPYVPRRRNGTPALIWFRGQYAAYSSFNCSVVALLTNEVRTAPSVRILSPAAALIHLPTDSNQLQLQAAVSDDGFPGPLRILWRTVSGPTNAVFSEPSSRDTFAAFPKPGSYVLSISADDTLSTNEARITVYVGPLTTDGADSTRVVWLKLDETSGTVASDSANTNRGMLQGGATWAPAGGIRGGALDFNGVDAVVTLADSAALDNTTAFTLAFWFRASAYPPNAAGLVSKRQSFSTGNAYSTYLDAATRRIFVDVDMSDNRFSSVATISTGVWYHVALTFDGSLLPPQRVKLWINGALDVVAYENSGILQRSSSPFRIGSMPATSGNVWFDGRIDDVRFYRRALSANEIILLALTNSAVEVRPGPVPAATNRIPASLNGQVINAEGKQVTAEWAQLSGPGTATFGDQGSPTTEVTFSKAGQYPLRLCATDPIATVCANLLVDVARNPNVYEDWIAIAFPAETNSNIIGPYADPDLDAQGNFLEFAFDQNPAMGGASPVRIRHGEDGMIRLSFPRRIQSSEVAYSVFGSADLESWMLADSAMLAPESTNRVPGELHETLTLRVVQPSSEMRFFKVRIEAPDL